MAQKRENFEERVQNERKIRIHQIEMGGEVNGVTIREFYRAGEAEVPIYSIKILFFSFSF